MLILYVLLHNKITQQKLHNKTNNTIAETVIYNEFCYEFVYSIFFSLKISLPDPEGRVAGKKGLKALPKLFSIHCRAH